MKESAYRVSALGLLTILAVTIGLPRVAHANDAEALLGGLIAGAIVYEMLDDDDGYCYGPGYQYYYRSPGYYRPYYDPWRYRGGRTLYYRDYCPPPIDYWYRTTPRRGYTYGYYDSGPNYGYQARRAPSHAQRNVGPPPLYQKGGGKYAPPGRYRK